MNNGTRIFLIILCILMIGIGAASIYFAASSVFAEEIEEPEQTTFVNFNQLITNRLDYSNSSTDNRSYFQCALMYNNGVWYSGAVEQTGIFDFILTASTNNTVSLVLKHSGSTRDLQIYAQNFTITNGHKYYFKMNVIGSNPSINGGLVVKDLNAIDLTLMFGAETANTMTTAQCQLLFKADYYPYNTGTTIDLSGFQQYNAGAMSARESMTINTTSANIADNLDNVVINSSYGSSNKALIQGYMVWGTQDQYTNCTALFNLETNFNEGDYFEFEFYTITGADSINLPNISTFYDLQIIALDSSGNIVPLATVKAQDNTNTSTKATFYLPFSTDKLYITTPHKYIIGYNNFKINITTTNLTALSLYSYKDGYKSGMSAGYTNGYNNGINGNNAALTSMDYIKSAFTTLGDILTIQVFPNVPLGTFFLLPLMASLIFFIVKVSKGG